MTAITKKQEEVIREIKQISDDTIDEVLDFIKFLKIRDSEAVDAFIYSEESLEEEEPLEEYDELKPEEDNV